MYLYWTESTTAGDSSVLSETPVLGNRVDRFTWDGGALTHHSNIIKLRALQQDAGQPERGNHNGGVLAFGPDGKLYIYMGDNGRRGQMQNLPDGPGCLSACTGVPQGNLPDDQFGGPEPDNAHLTGVILRLNDDGTAPADNPFFRAGGLRGGEVGANLQKVFAYGIRNGFGMAFDPIVGKIVGSAERRRHLHRVEPRRARRQPRVDPGDGAARPHLGVPRDRKRSRPARSLPGQSLLWSAAGALVAQQHRLHAGGCLRTPLHGVRGGDAFGATLEGRQENPAVTTGAGAVASFSLSGDGMSLSYELRATAPISRGYAGAHSSRRSRPERAGRGIPFRARRAGR